MLSLPYFIAIGLAAGVLAGLFGVGGGLVVVPALVLIGGMSQAAASGTSLVALLAPVGIGGVYAFYSAGVITATEIKWGLLISLGMVCGSYFGARIALTMSDVMLKRSFSVFLVIVAIKLWWETKA